MPVHTPLPRRALGLRETAESRLRAGLRSAELTWTTGGEALECLHKLASSPESAADALKLLHELQVFQVEIDLQYEQLERSQTDLAEQLSQHFELFERVAVGLVQLDGNGAIMMANPRAATLLGADVGSLSGQPFNHYVSVASRAGLATALAGLGDDTPESRCNVHTVKANGAGGELSLTATRSRDGHACMVVLTDAAPH